MRRLTSLALLCAAPVLASPAAAADGPSLYAPQPAATWVVTLKATAVVAPDYEGADDYELFGLPGLSFRRAGAPERFSAPDDGISIGLYETESFRIGPVVRIRGERDNDGERRGLRTVDWAVEAGVFAEFWPVDWLRTRAELRHGFNGHDGVVADLGADVVHTAGSWTLSAGPRIGFGGGDYMDTYFGVSPLEAARNRRIAQRFDPEGGLRYAGVSAAATYRWNEAWRTTVFGGYQRLVKDAADSPIVRRLGSPDQFTVGLRVAYDFGVNW